MFVKAVQCIISCLTVFQYFYQQLVANQQCSYARAANIPMNFSDFSPFSIVFQPFCGALHQFYPHFHATVASLCAICTWFLFCCYFSSHAYYTAFAQETPAHSMQFTVKKPADGTVLHTVSMVPAFICVSHQFWAPNSI